jgi:hypothetical protein
MTCYQISRDGEPVALVTRLAMAKDILHCQPPGHYSLDPVRVDDRPCRRRRWRKRPVRPASLDAMEEQDRPRHRWRHGGIGASFVRRKAATRSAKS